MGVVTLSAADATCAIHDHCDTRHRRATLGSVRKRPGNSDKSEARYRDAAGKSRSKSFRTKREAEAFLPAPWLTSSAGPGSIPGTVR